jgi:hypothetical protein
LHIDSTGSDYIDHACPDLLMNWAKQHEATGGSLVIDWESLHANFRRELESSYNGLKTQHPGDSVDVALKGSREKRQIAEAAASMHRATRSGRGEIEQNLRRLRRRGLLHLPPRPLALFDSTAPRQAFCASSLPSVT